jgi:hypothetical protein
MATMKACCPACQSRSIQRIKYLTLPINIAPQLIKVFVQRVVHSGLFVRLSRI